MSHFNTNIVHANDMILHFYSSVTVRRSATVTYPFLISVLGTSSANGTSPATFFSFLSPVSATFSAVQHNSGANNI